MGEHETGQLGTTAAEIYAQFFVPALFAQWPARVLDAADVQRGDRVLDIGCGTGVLTRAAQERAGATGAVTGIDNNPAMLTVARQQSGGDIAWLQAPAESLPFRSISFDRVVCQFSLMFFADRIKAIREMLRVARPGGKIAVAVWADLQTTPGYAAVAELLRALFGPDVAKSVQTPYALGNPEVLRALFMHAGVLHARLQTLPGMAHFASIDEWVYTDIKGWTLANALSDAEFSRLRQAAHEKLAHFVQNDGSVAFAAPAHIVTVET